MAEFCKKCSIEHFGKDFKELAGLITEDKVKEGFGASVLCEGCGATLVDHEGVCILPDCLVCNKEAGTDPLIAESFFEDVDAMVEETCNSMGCYDCSGGADEFVCPYSKEAQEPEPEELVFYQYVNDSDGHRVLCEECKDHGAMNDLNSDAHEDEFYTLLGEYNNRPATCCVCGKTH